MVFNHKITRMRNAVDKNFNVSRFILNSTFVITYILQGHED